MKMILTSECETCEYGSIDESNKARIKVRCNARNKEYYYGQCIPCDDKKKRKEVISSEKNCTV